MSPFDRWFRFWRFQNFQETQCCKSCPVRTFLSRWRIHTKERKEERVLLSTLDGTHCCVIAVVYPHLLYRSRGLSLGRSATLCLRRMVRVVGPVPCAKPFTISTPPKESRHTVAEVKSVAVDRERERVGLVGSCRCSRFGVSFGTLVGIGSSLFTVGCLGWFLGRGCHKDGEFQQERRGQLVHIDFDFIFGRIPCQGRWTFGFNFHQQFPQIFLGQRKQGFGKGFAFGQGGNGWLGRWWWSCWCGLHIHGGIPRTGSTTRSGSRSTVGHQFGKFVIPSFSQRPRQFVKIGPLLIVILTIGPYFSHIQSDLLQGFVLFFLQLFLHRAQIHGLGDNFGIIKQAW